MPPKKICKRCTKAKVTKGWTCRSCGAECCAHLCSHKVGNEATCGACLLANPAAAPRKPSFHSRLADLRASIDQMQATLGKPKRRRSTGPTTEQRMAEALSPILSEMLGTFVPMDAISIYVARGYWTHAHQDVQCWTGDVKVQGTSLSLGSWDNLWSALKGGFEVIDHREAALHAGRPLSLFEIVAKKPQTRAKK